MEEIDYNSDKFINAKAEMDRLVEESLKTRTVKPNVLFGKLSELTKATSSKAIEWSRQVDISELKKIANDIGLPVEAPNGHAFPRGTSAIDFSDLSESS